MEGNRLTYQGNTRANTYYTYNAANQLTDLTNRSTATGTPLLSEFVLTYDGTGNRSSIVSTIPGAGSAPAASGSVTYSYDSTSTKVRLTNESASRASTYGGTFSSGFVSDAANNLTTLRGSTLSYNADNQLSGTGYTFDGNGNPTTYLGQTFGYDVENRLTSIGSAFTAGYCSDDRRAWKQNASGRTYFLYDGGHIVCELNSSGTVTRAYGWGAAGLMQVYYPLTPALASFTFDPAGNTVSRLWSGTSGVSDIAVTDAYGIVLDISATTGTSTTPPDPVGYGGQFGNYTDWDTGLVLMGHRYYDPGKARFLTRDPIGYNGGINVYAYCGNNPVNSIDPSGLSAGIVYSNMPNFWDTLFREQGN